MRIFMIWKIESWMLNEKQCPALIFHGSGRRKKINHHSLGLDQIECLGRLSSTHRAPLKYWRWCWPCSHRSSFILLKIFFYVHQYFIGFFVIFFISYFAWGGCSYCEPVRTEWVWELCIVDEGFYANSMLDIYTIEIDRYIEEDEHSEANT